MIALIKMCNTAFQIFKHAKETLTGSHNELIVSPKMSYKHFITSPIKLYEIMK